MSWLHASWPGFFIAKNNSLKWVGRYIVGKKCENSTSAGNTISTKTYYNHHSFLILSSLWKICSIKNPLMLSCYAVRQNSVNSYLWSLYFSTSAGDKIKVFVNIIEWILLSDWTIIRKNNDYDSLWGIHATSTWIIFPLLYLYSLIEELFCVSFLFIYFFKLWAWWRCLYQFYLFEMNNE